MKLDREKMREALRVESRHDLTITVISDWAVEAACAEAERQFAEAAPKKLGTVRGDLVERLSHRAEHPSTPHPRLLEQADLELMREAAAEVERLTGDVLAISRSAVRVS